MGSKTILRTHAPLCSLIMAKVVLMITHDPEGGQGLWTYIHLVRNQDSWRCFLMFTRGPGGGPCLACYPMTLRSVGLLGCHCHESLFLQFLGLSCLTSSNLMSDTSQSRFSIRSSLWSGFRFLQLFQPLLLVLIKLLLLSIRTVYKNFMEIGTAILMSTGLAVSLSSRGGKGSSMSLDQYLFGPTDY